MGSSSLYSPGRELSWAAVPATHFCALSSEKGKWSWEGLSEEAVFDSESEENPGWILFLLLAFFVLTNPKSPGTEGFEVETTLLHLRRKRVAC